MTVVARRVPVMARTAARPRRHLLARARWIAGLDWRRTAGSGDGVRALRLDGVFIFGLALLLFKTSPANHQAGDVMVQMYSRHKSAIDQNAESF